MKKMMMWVSLMGILGACNSPTSTGLSSTQSASSTSPSTTTSGGSGTVTVQPTQPSSFSHFVYIANKGSDTISQYGLDTTNGYLWNIGVNNVITTHSQPSVLFLDVQQKYLFCIHANSTIVDVFSLNSATGLLTFVYSKDIAETVKGYYWNGTQLIFERVSDGSGKVYTYDSTTSNLTYFGNNYSAISFQYAWGFTTYSGTYNYSFQGTDNVELYTQKNGTWVDTGKGFSTGINPSNLLIF